MVKSHLCILMLERVFLPNNFSSFICIKKSVVSSLLIFFFSFLYVIKQTILNGNLIDKLLIVITILIIVLNLKRLLFFVRQNLGVIFYIIWSVLLAWVFFSQLETGLVSIIKLLLFTIFFLIDKDNNFLATKYMAIGFSIAISLIILLNLVKLIDGVVFDNGVWIKNSLGFNNPNIGPFFLASIAYGVIFINKKLSLFIFFVAIILLIFLSFYSRAEILTISTIVMVYVLNFFRFNTRILAITIFSLFSIFSILFYVSYFGFLNYDDFYLKSLNTLLSNRLHLIFSLPFLVASNGPIFLAEFNDGVLYEFLFVFGLPIFILFLYIAKGIAFESSNPHEITALIACITLGIFEGIINKVTPLGIGIFYFIFINHNYIRRGYKLMRSSDIHLNVIFIKLISLIGLGILVSVWNAPVIEEKIRFPSEIVYSDLVSVLSGNNHCNKLKVTLVADNNSNSHIITIIANSYNLTDKCSKGITDLVLKDFVDKNGLLPPHPIFDISKIELEKKNNLRYIMAFTLFIFGFFLPRNLISLVVTP